MFKRFLCIALLAGLTSAQEGFHEGDAPAEALLEYFNLERTFDTNIQLTPFDDARDFPWWVKGPGGEILAVIEEIRIEADGSGLLLVLDAQYLDGNDLLMAVPLSSP